MKERVRDSVDIIDVVGRDLELRPQGRHYVARCPFHNDKRPSMTVNQERQTWKCWVCDVGGDIFSFVMQREGVDFPTALKILADTAGIRYEDFARGKTKTQPGSPDDKATLLSAIKFVADEYYRMLESDSSDDAKIAREYLAERGINEQSRKRFRIGFSPDSWSHSIDLLKRHNLSEDVAVAAGVAIRRDSGSGYYDRFRGRLMFPIHDLQDRPISLGGRIIPPIANRRGEDGGGPKYINGPETKLYRKSNELYGLQLARDAIRLGGEALVMEGYTDVVAASQSGVETAVAVLGTALGEQHVKVLKRFSQRVVLVLDGDNAGQKRADEVLEIFVKADVDLRVLTLPEGDDPADYLAAHGRESFDAIVKAAPDAFDHKLARLTAGVDLTNDTHQATTAVETMLKIMAKAPRDGDLRSDQMMMRLSRTFGLSVERLEQRLATLGREEKTKRTYANKPRPNNVQAAPRPRSLSTPPPAISSDPNAALMESAEVDDFGGFASDSEFSRNSSPGPHVDQPTVYKSQGMVPLSGIDRELFETLITHPELAAMAVEAIDPNWMESMTAKMILSAYQDLDLAGRDLDVSSLLLLIENEQLKNEIVSLEQRVEQRLNSMKEKETYVSEPAETRYSTIITRYHQREFAAEKNRQIAKLETTVLPEDEELALLKEMFEAEQVRHVRKKI